MKKMCCAPSAARLPAFFIEELFWLGFYAPKPIDSVIRAVIMVFFTCIILKLLSQVCRQKLMGIYIFISLVLKIKCEAGTSLLIVGSQAPKIFSHPRITTCFDTAF